MNDKLLTTVEPCEGVMLVTLNRPKKRNALSAELKIALTETAKALSERNDIGAVILAGNGSGFTSGNDISEGNSFAQGLSLPEARRHIRLGLEMCNAWEAMPQLSIAAIEGFCVGGGISLAVACDFRILHSNAWLRAPEVELGITFSWGTLPRLVRLVGPNRAKLIAALARKIDAKTALSWGLCDNVVDDVMQEALDMAKEISAKPRVAQQMIKESINRLKVGSDNSTLEQDQVLLNMSDPNTHILQSNILKGLAEK